MKIVFVVPDMVGGGTERVVALLANKFVEKGHKVAVMLFAGNRVAYPLDPKVEICMAGEASGGKLTVRIKRIMRMRRFYRQNKDCCIFAFSVMGAVFSTIAAAGIPHRMLVSERNDPMKYEHRRIRNWSYQRVDKLVLQTEDMKQCFPKNIREKAVVIPNPVADGMPSRFEGERKKWVVSAARLEPQKNHKLLINAFAEFVKQHTDYELHLFGIGELQESLEQQVKELKICEKVIFHGFSPNVKEEIRDSAMFVLSSDYEGISNSMIEALAMGVPVISTDCPVGGSAAYIQNEESGILTPVGDKAALVRAMNRIADDPVFANKLSENAVKIKEKYSLSQIADRFLEEAGIQ